MASQAKEGALRTRCSIHPSACKVNSPMLEFRFMEFSEVARDQRTGRHRFYSQSLDAALLGNPIRTTGKANTANPKQA
jgi:hypothetical protein